jgi:hypothetical protein
MHIYKHESCLTPANQNNNTKNHLLLLHRSHADAYSPLVGVQALNSCERLYRFGETEQPVCCQVRAGDVLEEGAQVDARVLLGVSVCCWKG